MEKEKDKETNQIKYPQPAESWAEEVESILEKLKVDREKGLNSKEVRRRLKQFGRNRLREIKRKSPWTILINQLKSLIVLLLLAASVLSLILGQWMEAIAIFAAIAVFIVVGFFTELKAVRSVEALRRLGEVKTRVRREGEIIEAKSQNIVPGDIVVLEGGDIISADLRILEASRLQADESMLTGESLPVNKDCKKIKKDAPLIERSNMLFKGTNITRGSAEAVVVSTGQATELGKISSLVEETEEEVTPLEKRLNQLGHKLIWFTLILAALVGVAGILAGKEIFLMVETAIVLAVAAVPEGLPIVATLSLARGVWRMARLNALVEKLSAVETLGATGIICTDKTGTLTENRMSLQSLELEWGNIVLEEKNSGAEEKDAKEGEEVEPEKEHDLKEALTIGILCNNASLGKENDEEQVATGEPLEIALLCWGAEFGLKREKLIQKLPEEREESFDPKLKMMATFHRQSGGYYVAVKGAPESVLKVCSKVLLKGKEKRLYKKEKEKWLEKNQEMAAQGLRILALAYKEVKDKNAEPYKALVFTALAGFSDPPRKGVAEAVNTCSSAGVKVVMVTGDHRLTAKKIGEQIGIYKEGKDEAMEGKSLTSSSVSSEEMKEQILKATVFARVTPEQKLNLIDLYQKQKQVVAMTGDGVNDAPALKKADIGIAMGKGTQVAQQAADMVLTDNAFSTIVTAIRQGRVIFNNIRKFITYLLSCNTGSILAVGAASISGYPLPVLPLQILYLNLVTDVFPAIALGLGDGSSDLMGQPPRKSEEPVLTKRHWHKVIGLGIGLAVVVMAVLSAAIYFFQLNKTEAVTVSFLTLGFSRAINVFNMREENSRVLKNEITGNKYVWAAMGICLALLLASVYLPGLSDVLKTSLLTFKGWLLIVLGSVAFFLGGWLLNIVEKKVNKRRANA